MLERKGDACQARVHARVPSGQPRDRVREFGQDDLSGSSFPTRHWYIDPRRFRLYVPIYLVHALYDGVASEASPTGCSVVDTGELPDAIRMAAE
jgi:hypothetical protein